MRTAILISGGGSTMAAVLDAVKRETLHGIEPVIVISSDPGAAGLEKAAARGTRTAVVERKQFPNRAAFGNALLQTLSTARAELVAQLGWLPLTPVNVIENYPHRIFNQHPGPLDPGRDDFGGRGMHGIHVHAAIIAYQRLAGEAVTTEATTHLVTEEFDKGALLSTMALAVPKHMRVSKEYYNNTHALAELTAQAKALQNALLPLEHDNVITTLQMVAHGRATPHNRQKPLIPAQNIDMLGYAKQLAAQITD